MDPEDIILKSASRDTLPSWHHIIQSDINQNHPEKQSKPNLGGTEMLSSRYIAVLPAGAQVGVGGDFVRETALWEGSHAFLDQKLKACLDLG